MSRLDLQAALEKVGCPVHFEPPSNIDLKYPCIVYEYENPNTMHADNLPYLTFVGYKVMYITKDADSQVPKEILKNVKYGAIKNFFKADNLYHTVISCKELY